MILIIDKNQQSTNPEVVEKLQEFFGQANVIVTNLPHREFGNISVTAGDINIPLDDGSVLAIERKTPMDFLNSIRDRHIFNQVEVMAQHAKYSAIIITGKLTFSPDDKVMADREETNWGGSSIRATLDLIQYSGCALRLCPPAEYPYAIREIYNVVNKSSNHQGVFKNRIVTFPPTDERVQMLCQFPGVGIESAESILRFAGMMDNNSDEDGYGTLSGALHWITIMAGIENDSRPKHWNGKRGANKIVTIRKLLGLASNQYIAAKEE